MFEVYDETHIFVPEDITEDVVKSASVNFPGDWVPAARTRRLCRDGY